MVSIQLKLLPDLYKELYDQARAKGIPLRAHIRNLLAEATPSCPPSPTGPTYEIIEDAPPPPKRKRKYHYPDWSKMEVGDCVFIPGQSSQGPGAQHARAYGHKHGMKFSCETDWRGDSDREWGVYIWRFA